MAIKVGDKENMTTINLTTITAGTTSTTATVASINMMVSMVNMRSMTTMRSMKTIASLSRPTKVIMGLAPQRGVVTVPTLQTTLHSEATSAYMLSFRRDHRER